jgi:hypothetical protein
VSFRKALNGESGQLFRIYFHAPIAGGTQAVRNMRASSCYVLGGRIK